MYVSECVYVCVPALKKKRKKKRQEQKQTWKRIRADRWRSDQVITSLSI